MKTIFDSATRKEILNRIDLLNENSKPQWGKMNVAQMIKHCVVCEEYYFGSVPVKRSLLGRILGKVAIKSILKDDTTGLKKNSPTSQQFIIAETNLNLEAEKQHWKRLIEQYAQYPHESFVHWFFGTMTKEQLGALVYKHNHHHLSQFGV